MKEHPYNTLQAQLKKNSSFKDWLDESQDIAIRYVYDKIIEYKQPTPEYDKLNWPILEKQLVLAGYRLADVLINALDQIDLAKIMSKIPKLVDSSTQTERPKLEFQKLKSIEILPSVKPIKISSIPKEPKNAKDSTESKEDKPENDFGSAEELEECLNKEEELNQIKSIDFEKGITTIDEILEVHDDPNTKLEEFIKNHPSKS